MRLILIRARDFHIGAIPPPAVVSRTTPTSITPVESALMQLFILKNFKSRRMNTYGKPLGGYPLHTSRNAVRAFPSRIVAQRRFPDLPFTGHGPRVTDPVHRSRNTGHAQ